MSKILPFDKFKIFLDIIKSNGGLINSIFKLYRFDELKLGYCVGEDKYGNEYYEDNYYFLGRNRWVEYSEEVHLDYDASQIPVEWFGWIHNKTDLTPDKDPNRPKYPWMDDHTPNMSGTEQQSTPYSTTRPKIHAWVPPKPKRKCL
ncbi:putative NADH dehydrogenase [ubiquinone] 1 alpha subcomplex subunit 12 [Blattella germanica]|nr:putative NADH dehydrogenase [ubiquinone] 1 alpha subcomplex subunit 12 [Blattella germanica]